MKKTPLAIFTYNRPIHTRHMLETLTRCVRLDECDIVIFCDGLKKEEHQLGVELTRQFVEEWAKQHSAQDILRVQNLGLKKSIETGVSDLCRQYGRIIVLEDDILVSKFFVDFMLSALDHYEHDERVMQVAGYTFPFAPNAKQEPMLLPIVTTWGWATWMRAWQHYNPDPNDAHKELQERNNALSFDLNGAYPYTQMLMGVAQGKDESWGVLFWYAVWQKKGLVVYPRLSLTRNVGFDGSGVNSGRSNDVWHQVRIQERRLPVKWVFPSSADLEAFSQLRSFLKRHIAPKKFASRVTGIKRTLKLLAPSFVKNIVKSIYRIRK